MRRFAITFYCLLFSGAAAAQSGVDIGERIEQGLSAADGPAEAPVSGLFLPPDAQEDASLAANVRPSRLQTTLSPLSVGQRIDRGLTAAGEESVFPPDLAYGAFQRGWFLTAFSLALERAEQGDAKAQTLLGELLSRGLGVEEDLTAAADWYRLAAQGGDREALYALGRLYLDGGGVEADAAEGVRLLREAADLGHPGAARELGYLLLQGSEDERNPMLAAAYLRRAADGGDMDAQYTLAGLFAEGIGVVADEVRAAEWFAAAARNGHVGAQVEYAILLFNGRGVPRDEEAAARWFAEAARADNPAAQLRLARLLAEGRGVEVDIAAAARWYLIARGRGLEDDYLDNVLRDMTPEARATAEAAAERWNSVWQSWVAAEASPLGGGTAVDNMVQ
jgi:TPR repeat protein